MVILGGWVFLMGEVPLKAQARTRLSLGGGATRRSWWYRGYSKLRTHTAP